MEKVNPRLPDLKNEQTAESGGKRYEVSVRYTVSQRKLARATWNLQGGQREEGDSKNGKKQRGNAAYGEKGSSDQYQWVRIRLESMGGGM